MSSSFLEFGQIMLFAAMLAIAPRLIPFLWHATRGAVFGLMGWQRGRAQTSDAREAAPAELGTVRMGRGTWRVTSPAADARKSLGSPSVSNR